MELILLLSSHLKSPPTKTGVLRLAPVGSQDVHGRFGVQVGLENTQNKQLNITKAATDHISIRILHTGSKARDKADSRNDCSRILMLVCSFGGP